jgi:hypothetical protein
MINETNNTLFGKALCIQKKKSLFFFIKDNITFDFLK